MAKKNDSFQVAQCLGWDSKENQRGDIPVARHSDQQRSETCPERFLMDFSDESTSFANPVPSVVAPGTAGVFDYRCGDEARAGAEGVRLESRMNNMRHESSGTAPGTSREHSKSGRFRKAQDCNVKMPPLHYSQSHTVLINVNDFRDLKLCPVKGRLQWDALHVKMPHSKENIFISKSTFLAEIEKQPRWNIISKHLKRLQKGSPTVADVEKAIMSYNPQYQGVWSFAGLKKYAETIPKQESIFSQVIPKMAELALRLPEHILRAIPLLRKDRSHSITLSQLQIATLLANAFFCTFPHRNATTRNAEYANYPSINFSSLFGNSSPMTTEKLRAIFHYFNTVTCEATQPLGLVTFERCYILDNQFPRWRSRTELLGNVSVNSEGTIEKEGKGMLQVDFACSLIGGGVLGSGLVQEEILFLMNPELIVARLFTEKLDHNECLRIKGAQQYSEYAGYSRSFEWSGSHHEDLLRDCWGRLHRHIVAIDALNFKHPSEQYQKSKIKRELNKAFVGFSEKGSELPAIATGNWGCGAFNGDPIFKALIQMMAAAVTQRDMVFFTFRDKRLENDVWKIYTLLKERKATVGGIYTMLDSFCLKRASEHVDLFTFILMYFTTNSSL